MNKQEARNILGVTKASSKEDVERKYDIVLKKYRLMKMEGTLDDKAQAEFDDSTEAYKVLMGYVVNEPAVPKKETYTDKAFVKAGIDPKKANNFFYYHKVHIIVGIIVLVLIGSFIRSVVTRVEPDATIGLMGLVNQQEFENFGEKIKERIPGVENIAFDSAILSGDPNDPQAYVYMQKAMILLSASDCKLFIVSKYAYDIYSQNGAFMPLEDIADELGIDTKGSEHLKTRVVEEWEEITDINAERKPKVYADEEPRLYGIDITDNKFMADAGILGPERILVLRAADVKKENKELTNKLIKLFTE